jgi:hypothetical protein
MEAFAPATTAPVGSVTTPVTVPRSTCPQPGAVKSVPIKTARQNLWKNMHTSANVAEIRSTPDWLRFQMLSPTIAFVKAFGQ